MIKNYLKIAWRNLRKQKSYTIINLTGLAVGMACCILIALYVREELSFDSFHQKEDRIVAVGSKSKFFGTMLQTPYPLADALVDKIPSVEKAVHVKGTQDLNLSLDGQTYIKLEQGLFSEPAFFDLFSFPLIKGNTSKSLEAPNSIVLTEQSSKKLFGSENPLGQSIYWQQRDTMLVLTVRGITANVPQNSSLQFDALISLNTRPQKYRDPEGWRAYSYRTFALLRPKEATGVFPQQLQVMAKKHYATKKNPNPSQTFFSIPLSQFHLSSVTPDSGFTGNRNYLYLFGSIALFILVIACVNYVNLATARTSLRAKEVGVRKTLGARRLQVAIQFLGESLLLSVSAFFIGLVLAGFSLPFFNRLFGTVLQLSPHMSFLIWLFGAAVLVGLFSGIYPALYLSGFSPISVLRNRMSQALSGALLRKSLVVSQFAIALVLIIGSIVVFRQLHFTQTTDLGFDGHQVMMVPFTNAAEWQLRDEIRTKTAALPGVQDASVVSGAPGEFRIYLGNKPSEISSQEQAVDKEKSIIFAPAVVDYNFLNLLHIKLLAGRNFSKDLSTDKEQAYIINKKASEKLGWTPEEAIGKPFKLGGEGKVIGVVENFHIKSLRDAIMPVVLQLHESSSWSSGGLLLARLAPDNIPASVQAIKEEIKKYAPHTSVDYEFMDQKFDAMYRTEQRFGTVVGLFTVIAILIACLGLYGLAAFAAERRTKEIGVRKVVGATVANIVALLSKDFLKLVAIGFVIAAPIAWYAMHWWLQEFAYKINISPGIFLLAGGLALLVALATISWQSIKAALTNPVDSLRSE